MRTGHFFTVTQRYRVIHTSSCSARMANSCTRSAPTNLRTATPTTSRALRVSWRPTAPVTPPSKPEAVLYLELASAMSGGNRQGRSAKLAYQSALRSYSQTRYGLQASRGLSSDEKYPILADVLHADPSDTLKNIKVYHQLEACL